MSHNINLSEVALFQMQIQMIFDNNLKAYVHPEGIHNSVKEHIQPEDYVCVPCLCGCGDTYSVIPKEAFERAFELFRETRIKSLN